MLGILKEILNENLNIALVTEIDFGNTVNIISINSF